MFMPNPVPEICVVTAVSTERPAGVVSDELWHLRLYGRDHQPLGLDGAINQIMPLLHHVRACPQILFRMDSASFAKLPGCYYAPFFRAKPNNLMLPTDWLPYCPPIKQPFRLLVAGSRDYDDFDLLSSFLTHITARMDKTRLALISGKAKGADALGEQWARENAIPVVGFPALWDDLYAPRARVKTGHYGSYNPRAGADRNAWMVANATHAVLFPSNLEQISRGIRNMQDLLQRFGTPCRICRWQTE
jgi:hypothetical protein